MVRAVALVVHVVGSIHGSEQVFGRSSSCTAAFRQADQQTAGVLPPSRCWVQLGIDATHGGDHGNISAQLAFSTATSILVCTKSFHAICSA